MARRAKPSKTNPRLYGRHAVAAALANPERGFVRLHATHDAIVGLELPKGLVVEMGHAADLARFVPNDAPHQGLVLEVEALDGAHLDELIASGPGPIVVLDGVTDPHNVGAILRSAAAFGAAGLVTQDRHAPGESGALAKAASGALETVRWARVINLARALGEIGDAGLWRIGLDGSAARPLEAALGTARVALVLGAEGEGMRPNTAAHCDELARLAIAPGVDSLNVSNAAAVALYAAARR